MSGPASLPHIGLNLGGPRTLTAETGTYTLTGSEAVLVGPGGTPAPLPHLALLGGLGLAPNVLRAESGSYTLTGQDAGSSRAYSLTAERGFYITSGQVAALELSQGRSGDPAPLPHLGLLLPPATLARTLTCDTGIYTLVGSDALIDWEVTAEQGSYAISGQVADLRVHRILTAESGSYALSGQDALFSRSGAALVMPAESGVYSVTGSDAGLTVGYRLGGEHGFYGVGGQAASLALGLSTNYIFAAETGVYSLSGFDAELTPSGPVLLAETGYYSVQGYSVVSNEGAGRGSRGFAVERDGRIEFFETEKQAEQWLKEQLPVLEKKVKKAAKRIARAVVKGEPMEAFKPPLLIAPVAVQPVIEKKIAALETTFHDTLEAERKRLEAEEEEAVILLLM